MIEKIDDDWVSTLIDKAEQAPVFAQAKKFLEATKNVVESHSSAMFFAAAVASLNSTMEKPVIDKDIASGLLLVIKTAWPHISQGSILVRANEIAATFIKASQELGD